MGNVLKKNYPCATCQHCGKVTDIQLSGDYRSLIVQNKTLKEALKFTQDTQRRIHIMKNSEVQLLHKKIKQLIDLMTPEQQEQARKISQEMREELKKVEKIR
ncbi:MAG: hypothetical protein AABY22_16145 [Nanoarchaeota archaeon]